VRADHLFGKGGRDQGHAVPHGEQRHQAGGTAGFTGQQDDAEREQQVVPARGTARGRGEAANEECADRVDLALMTGRQACERLLRAGVLVKDTHGATIRFAPPLTVTEDDIHWAVDRFAEILVP
jgi:acetylornithine/succinyldiaminopimelate/putrescine aminotransferase